MWGFTHVKEPQIRLMNELIITIVLFIPPAAHGIHWDVNEIPNQVVITYKTGVQASYSTTQVPCNAVAIKKGWALYKTKSTNQPVCYLTDVSSPVMVRGPWRGVMVKTYQRD